jgi:hypothetical protein
MFDAMTDAERAVLGCIEPGRGRAVPVNVIALLTNLPERRVRRIVRGLIDEHGVCIGSSTAPPAGYFLINNPEEIEAAYRRLRHRGISILARAARLRDISVVDVFGQGELVPR